VGEIRQGAVFDFAILAVAFAEEDRGTRAVVGDSGDVHAYRISLNNYPAISLNNYPA